MAKIQELLNIQEAKKAPVRYGLLCITDGDGRIDYDQWEETEFFTDADDFLTAVTGQFEYFLSGGGDEEGFPDTVKWSDLTSHPQWDEFCENCWITQNFFK